MTLILSQRKGCLHVVQLFIGSVVMNALFFSHAFAQENRAVMGQMATCKVTVGNTTSSNNATTLSSSKSKIKAEKKVYQPKPNQLGFFDQVSKIQPLQTVPIELSYPQGKPGEKVLVSAKDGGKFENGKSILATQLDAQKRVSFNFQVSDQLGLFRVSLQKGNDIKVVQLWVGSDPFSSAK